MAAELRRTGHTLSPSHFRLLALLYHRKWSLGELAQHESVSPPTISKSISTLEERGWARRTPSDEDGRVIYAELTDKGRSVFDAMHEEAKNWLAEGLQRLEESERQQLLDGLSVLESVVLQRMIEAGIDPAEFGSQTPSTTGNS
ncbi:MAG: MarR family transcriptional regulator [Anaerolineales bacterium]|nr:MarR family transcriptional regulator [Anaerolineales bacterium]